jgi:hypothetical protein
MKDRRLLPENTCSPPNVERISSICSSWGTKSLSFRGFADIVPSHYLVLGRPPLVAFIHPGCCQGCCRAAQPLSDFLTAALPNSNSGLWWAAVDSNHLPPRYQHGALPVELAALRAMAGAEGFEPSALGFGDRCSDQTELRPFGQTESLPARLRVQRADGRVGTGARRHQHPSQQRQGSGDGRSRSNRRR